MPARQLDDQAGRLAAEEMRGALHWRCQAQPRAGGRDGGRIMDFRLNADHVRHTVFPPIFKGDQKLRNDQVPSEEAVRLLSTELPSNVRAGRYDRRNERLRFRSLEKLRICSAAELALLNPSEIQRDKCRFEFFLAR